MPSFARTALAVLALAATGCGADGGGGDGGPIVVATTPQVADIARGVAAPGTEVVALIPAGADPHDFEIRPSAVDALSRAELVVRSGGEVDEWLAEAVEAAGGDAPVLTVIDRVEAIPGDPHWWQDPRNGVRAAEAIAAELGTDASEYAARLRELDAAIARCWARVPAGRRGLVGTHDSLRYYARRYGLEVVGAVVPSATTQGQASAGDVDALVERIRRHDVRAVFPEAGAAHDVEAAVAAEARVRLGRPLHTDSLAEEGAAATYAGALAENTRALIAGLTGDEAGCPQR